MRSGWLMVARIRFCSVSHGKGSCRGAVLGMCWSPAIGRGAGDGLLGTPGPFFFASRASRRRSRSSMAQGFLASFRTLRNRGEG